MNFGVIGDVDTAYVAFKMVTISYVDYKSFLDLY